MALLFRSVTNSARKAFLLLAFVFIGCSSAVAETVVLKATKLYGGRHYSGITTYFDSGSAAAAEGISSWCYGKKYACTSVYSEDRFIAGDNQWNWISNESWMSKRDIPPDLAFSGEGVGGIFFECPAGWLTKVSKTVPEGVCEKDVDQPPCFLCSPAAPMVGNPVDVTSGVKREVAVDYENASGTLRLVRTYRSDTRQWQHNYSTLAVDLNIRPEGAGCYWAQGSVQGEWGCYPYVRRGESNEVLVSRNGRLAYFGTITDLSGPKDINDRITLLNDATGQRIGTKVTNGQTDEVELYAVDGRLLSSTTRAGLTTTFSYSSAETPPEIAKKAGLLIAVTDHYGKSLRFAYDDEHRIVTMTDPAGQLYQYAYQDGTLKSISYPDGKVREYRYGESEYTSGGSLPHVLTGIIDENGARYATFSYEPGGQAISTEHAGGVGKFTLSYPYYYQTNVTDPLGTVRRYRRAKQLGNYRNIWRDEPNEAGTANIDAAVSYDDNANISRLQDFDWKITEYTYDLTRNLETKRIDAAGSNVARTTSTEWHPIFRLPARVAEPKRITSYTYDTNGNQLTRSVQATNDATGASGFGAAPVGLPQVWTSTYDALGHLLTVDGPRTDVSDVTRYAYDTEGNLVSVTNALGQVTAFGSYDAHGRAGTITDPNGLVTQLTYSPRGWLTAVTIGAETTSYEYDGVGQMTRATMPDGSYVSYTYDPAHRLTAISDNLGNTTIYTLDNAGNRIKEETKDASGVLARQISRVYNAQNRIKQITGAVQ